MIIIYSENIIERRQISNHKYQKLGILKKSVLVPKCRYRHFGTSLSKAFHVIDRFSEDVDITFTEHIGSGRRKKLKYNILKPISEELKMPIRNWDKIESDKDYNRYDFGYTSISEEENPEPPKVIVETALMSYSFPTEMKEITSLNYSRRHENINRVCHRNEIILCL